MLGNLQGFHVLILLAVVAMVVIALVVVIILVSRQSSRSRAVRHDASSRLAELTLLHQQGLVTDEEYDHKRAEILREM